MDLSNLKPHTRRQSKKRVGRGGKRGTTSGHGTKGQKGRAGASVKPGFRGGDNRIWQLFPKQRGASKKHGNSSPHRKHRFFMLASNKSVALNLGSLNSLADGSTVSVQTLFENGLIGSVRASVKILSGGQLKRKLSFSGVGISKSAAEKIVKAGGKITEVAK